MGIIKGKFIKGALGDAVFREYRDTQVIQAKPRKNPGSRTEGTKKAASLFGVASSMARDFRVSFTKLINGFYDGTMIYRLNTEVLHSLRFAKTEGGEGFNFTSDSFDRLDGFEFNVASPLKNALLVWPELRLEEEVLLITLPALRIPQDLKFPKESDSCRLILGVTAYDLQERKRIQTAMVFMDIPNQAGLTLRQQWEFAVPNGLLSVTALSLQFVKAGIGGETIINSKAFSPAAILKAIK